jgi:hypothetical protein
MHQMFNSQQVVLFSFLPRHLLHQASFPGPIFGSVATLVTSASIQIPSRLGDVGLREEHIFISLFLALPVFSLVMCILFLVCTSNRSGMPSAASGRVLPLLLCDSSPVKKDDSKSCGCTMVSLLDGVRDEEAVSWLFGCIRRRRMTTLLLLLPRFNNEDIESLSSVMLIQYLQLSSAQINLKCKRQVTAGRATGGLSTGMEHN